MKTSVKIALFVVLFIALGTILTGLYFFNLKHKDMTKTKPDFTITATMLQKEFEDNESAATTKYVNKVLEITGRIASVKGLDNNIVNISLETGNDLSAVICTFPAITDPAIFSCRKRDYSSR